MAAVSLDGVRHVHLIAVAGTAMGTLACMLGERGMRVTGSDTQAYPPMSDQLRDAGIPVLPGFAAEHVLRERPDLVIIGNAVRRENPEARAVVEAGIPYLSMPDAIRHLFIEGRHSVVVTGTHGKTTSTSLLGWTLTQAGLDPGVLVGGVAANLGKSYRLGDGPHFVIEGDEYDTAYFDKTPKFLHYAPRTVLFTSCEFDHADIYASLEEIEKAFRTLASSLPPEGRLVAATAHPGVANVVESSSAPIESYGIEADSFWHASDVSTRPEGTAFRAWRGEDCLGKFFVPLFGRHNLENAIGSLAICAGLGLAPDAIASGFASFAGVRRRQEVRGEASGVVVVDDFAHHPTAVRETIAAIRARYPERTLWAIFEPRTNTSRRRVFEAEYVDALSGADRVLLADVYHAEQIPEDERMRPDHVVASLAKRGVRAEFLPEVDAIIEAVVSGQRGCDAALIMSNGDFGGIWTRLLERLRNGETD